MSTLQVSLISIFVLTSAVALLVGMTVMLGPHGFGISLYACVLFWYGIANTKSDAFAPLNYYKPTILDLIIAVLVCAVLHGLAIPAREM